jgi:hypothetical protein
MVDDVHVMRSSSYVAAFAGAAVVVRLADTITTKKSPALILASAITQIKQMLMRQTKGSGRIARQTGSQAKGVGVFE